jgi:hypothetical protein
MTDKDANAEASGVETRSLWAKYEDIAMHFNDLLMRLRTQSLAGIAAVSTLVGLFTKEGMATPQTSWLAATAIFIAMACFWIAICFLDFLYYNRLLIGAVRAIISLERKTDGLIEMSTSIESAFKKRNTNRDSNELWGVKAFYLIVLLVISGGAVFSGKMYCDSKGSPTSPTATHAVTASGH